MPKKRNIVTPVTAQKLNQRHISPFKVNVMQSMLTFHMFTYYTLKHLREDRLEIQKLLIRHAGVTSNVQENMTRSKFSKEIRVIT